MPPNRRVTSPRLALVRAFLATLLVATTLFGVRAAVSGAASSLPPGGLTALPGAAANELPEATALGRRDLTSRNAKLRLEASLSAGRGTSSTAAAPVRLG